ncbi:MAG: Flp pilus assembly complex ATPase component TadA [Dehalococcoidales bacterium]|nr:MAG: Flp pilus assembly complex ATPase component TadA [Dehalococcoidales bacterium]
MYNYNRFYRFFEPPEPFSILELVNTGTLDLHLAAILWMMMEQRSSIIVGAGPSYSGKTTMLNALLDLLPPDMKRIYLYGDYHDFGFVKTAVPSKTYMVAEEFNTHLNYVWGQTAITAFTLLKEGYSMGGTMHARTPQEVVYLFHKYLGLSLPLISYIDAVVNINVTWDKDYRSEPVRQVESVGLLLPGDEETLSLGVVALREEGENNLKYADSAQLRKLFSEKYEADLTDIEKEIAIREQYLEQLMIDMRISHQEVREAVVDFYNSR